MIIRNKRNEECNTFYGYRCKNKWTIMIGRCEQQRTILLAITIDPLARQREG